MTHLTDQLSPEREAELCAGIDRMLAELTRVDTRYLTCRYIAEHGDPCDWCQATRDAYARDIAEAGAK